MPSELIGLGAGCWYGECVGCPIVEEERERAPTEEGYDAWAMVEAVGDRAGN